MSLATSLPVRCHETIQVNCFVAMLLGFQSAVAMATPLPDKLCSAKSTLISIMCHASCCACVKIYRDRPEVMLCFRTTMLGKNRVEICLQKPTMNLLFM